jgi:hypothetical protein
MIIEVNSKLLDMPEQINLNQLVFLSMILDKNQKPYQDVQKIVSLISDDEISYLINQGLITSMERGNSIIYQVTDKVNDFVKPNKSYFDLFYDIYPVYVVRPDGSKSYLRANVNKCRHLYNNYIGNSEAMAEHINKCLEFEISKKMREGKLSYMKTMWRWLVDHQWEETEQEMQNTEEYTNSYGTELI